MRPKFIQPPNNPLQASKELREQLKRDLEELKNLGGTEEDLEAHRKALENLDGDEKAS